MAVAEHQIILFQLLHLQEVFGKDLVHFGKPKQIVGGEKGENCEFWGHKSEEKCTPLTSPELKEILLFAN